MSNELNIVSNKHVSAGVTPNSGTVSAMNSKVNTVFENSRIDVLKLTDEEKKYLLSVGINPDTATAKAIKQALEESPASILKEFELVQEQPSDVVQNSDVTNENPIKNSEKPAVSSVKNETLPKVDIDIDYKSENNKNFLIDPEKTGVYACDVDEKFKAEDKENFLVIQLAKHQLGDKWDKLSKEEQLAAQKSVEASLEKSVPSWKNLKTEDKGNLAKAFIDGSLDIAKSIYFDETEKSNIPLDEQIETAASKIIQKREKAEYKQKCITQLDNAAGDWYAEKTGGSNSVYCQGGAELERLRSSYLDAKVADNKELTSYEKEQYEIYQKAKKFNNNDLSNIKCSADPENSTFDQLKKDEAFIVDSYGAEEGSDEFIQALSNNLKYRMKDLNPEEQEKLFTELRDNCRNIEEQSYLYKAGLLLQKENGLTNVGKIDGNQAAIVKGIVITESPEAQISYTNELNQAIQNGSVDETIGVSVVTNANEIFEKENVSNAASIILETNKDAITNAYANAQKKYSVNDQLNIGTNVFENKENKYTTNTQTILAKNIGNSDVEVQKPLVDKANDTGKVEVIDAVGSNIHKLDKTVQTDAAISTMSASEKLSDEDAVKVQKNLADQIELCDKDNQLEMHNTVLTSKHEEVLERASSNIYKYDESVQADAITASYNTGNERAIEAVVSQLDKCSESAVRATAAESAPRIAAIEEKYSNKAAGMVADYLISEYNNYSNLSADDKNVQKANYIKEFLTASPQEQYKMLSKLPQSMQGSALTLICRYCPNMLAGLVKQGYGKQILKTPGMSSEVVYKVVNVMFESQESDKVEAAKYVTDHKTLFSKVTTERADDIMEYAAADKIKKSKNKEYASKPEFFKSALKPKMSDIYPDAEQLFFNG